MGIGEMAGARLREEEKARARAISLYAEQWEILDRMAGRENISVSAAFRRILREWGDTHVQPPAPMGKCMMLRQALALAVVAVDDLIDRHASNGEWRQARQVLSELLARVRAGDG